MTDWRETIERGAERMGVVLSAGQVDALVEHLSLLREASGRLNLTSVPPEGYPTLHVLDSLAAAADLATAPPGPFIDLGSGAGFPGIPLAVVSGRHADLVESTGKKARFLERVVGELRLDATVHGIRAEEAVAAGLTDRAAAVARAVSSLPSLLELAAPLLAVDGLAVCLKGDLGDEEIQRGRRAAEMLGMRERSIREVTVPGLDARRTVAVYEKTGRKPRVALPRRPGTAQRKPLT